MLYRGCFLDSREFTRFEHKEGSEMKLTTLMDQQVRVE